MSKKRKDKILKGESDIIKDIVAKRKGRRRKKDRGKGGGGKLYQHKHCVVCFKAIALDKDYCSEECREQHETRLKKQKRMMYVMYGIMAIVFVVVILTSLK